MRALTAVLCLVPLLLSAALPAWAQSPLVAELRAALEEACFIYGDVRARSPEEKIEAYDRGRQAAKRAIELAPHYTNMRVGLARTLWKKGRTADARHEALTVLDEKAPSNPADWAVKDVPQAQALLGRMKDRS